MGKILRKSHNCLIFLENIKYKQGFGFIHPGLFFRGEGYFFPLLTSDF